MAQNYDNIIPHRMTKICFYFLTQNIERNNNHQNGHKWTKNKNKKSFLGFGIGLGLFKKHFTPEKRS